MTTHDDFYLRSFGAQITRAEREFIKSTTTHIASTFSSPLAVNIGVMAGCSMHCMRAGSYTIDLIGVDIEYGKYLIRHKAQLDAVLVEAESATYGRVFQRPIALLMIDGDHHYIQVHDDIAAWVPHVQLSGIVIFHDYAPSELNMRQFPELEGVRCAVDEYFDGNDNWEKIDGPDSIVAFRRLE